jgi:anti-sigma regulatory factor (Ser/Thr protein kinase)
VIRDIAAADVPADVLEDLQLCVTELVTNGVKHSDTHELEMSVRVSPATVRVEVGDHGTGFELHPATPSLTRAGGYGLYIVELLADRWGVDRRELNWVWFEMDLEAAGAPQT